MVLLTAGLSGCGDRESQYGGVNEPAGALQAAETITEADILRRISVIAHDSMRGRRTPSPELDEVAAWAAREFEAMGLEPAMEDGWVQRYTIRTEVPDFEGSTARMGDRTLQFGSDLGMPFGPQAEALVDAPLVVVSGSRGWQRGVARASLGGAAVVVVGGSGESGPRTRQALQIFNAIRDAGAAVMVYASDLSDTEWEAAIGLQQETAVTRPLGFAQIPVLTIRDRVLAESLRPHDIDLDDLRSRGARSFEASAVPGPGFLATVRNRVLESVQAPNVAARLAGADPGLAGEVVLLSAHMDHVGVGRPDASGDSIFNGADDDASGTVTVMEVAEALASMEVGPRRSFIFLLVSGEERGLWGSRWFAENPPVPLEQIVANLNLDMVGRNWGDTIAAIGKEHSDLGRTLEGVNRQHPELGMSAVDDLWPGERFYFRSDHYNFASRGVPILFFFSGTHEDYHEPSDEIEKIDGEKTARIGRLVYYLGLEVANRDARPQWEPDSYDEIAGN